MAAMRPDPPLDTTCRDLSSAPMSAGTALMTTDQRRTCCLVWSADTQRDKESPGSLKPGL